jgi:short-subunit dehydrogenase
MSRMIALNVEALMRLTYAVVLAFVKRGAGTIINEAARQALMPNLSRAEPAARYGVVRAAA